MIAYALHADTENTALRWKEIQIGTAKKYAGEMTDV